MNEMENGNYSRKMRCFTERSVLGKILRRGLLEVCSITCVYKVGVGIIVYRYAMCEVRGMTVKVELK